MRPLHSISADNFLSLQAVEVDLGPLNVLVGPNASGKTNLLKVIQFLGDTVRTDLMPAVTEHGGFDALRFRGTTPSPKKRKSKKAQQSRRTSIRIGIKAQVTKHSSPNALDEYSLSFWEMPLKQGPKILARSESLRFKRVRGRGRRITVQGRRVTIHDEAQEAETQHLSLGTRSSGLSTLRRLGEEQGAERVDELATLFETFRVFEVDADAARQPSAVPYSDTLASDGSNLAAFLAWMSKAHPETFQLLSDDLAAIVPGVSGIHLRPVGGSNEGITIAIAEHALEGLTDLGAASFGTVRGLAILAMLHDPNPPLLTCVEEIDHGLHPHALDRIVERMRDATQRTQLMVVTHSPALVNRLTPSELLVCERSPTTGASRIPAIDPELVAEMADAGELDLGELWFSGALGGSL